MANGTWARLAGAAGRIPPFARATLVLVVLAFAALGLSACGGPGGLTLPTLPVLPEQLPAAIPGAGEQTLACSEVRTFPASALSAPTGAEKAVGPEYDALRTALADFGPEFAGSADWTWLLAGRDATGATFLSKTSADAWTSIDVKLDATGWKAGGMGDCRLRVVVAAGFGPASWGLDPAFPAPTPTTTEVHILVWELACSGGASANGRISAPVVHYDATTVTIALGVRPIEADPGVLLTCPGPPGAKATLTLREPLGSRTLLDGGQFPPVAPAKPLGS